MRFSVILVPILAASGVAAARQGQGQGQATSGKAGANGASGNSGKGTNSGSTTGTGATTGSGATTGAGNSTAQAGGNGATGGTVQTSQQGTPVNQLGINGGQAGGALNAGATGSNGPNGLPQLANPQANFNAATNTGTFGPFTPVSSALAIATGAPTSVDASTAQALQAAADNWSFDTAQVSNFLNTGKSLTGQQFNQGANIAYNAEVDELTHKAILDSVIGNDPDVSIANQTLTNGVFQSVVNNLQIMADQGANTQQLIDFISNVRCTQILPSIDTYMAVAARVIGSGATLRTAIRPDTCPGIVAAAPNSAFPGNIQVVNVRSNADRSTAFAPAANPNQGKVTNPIGGTAAAGGSTTSGSTTGGTGTNTGASTTASQATTASGASAAGGKTGKGTTGASSASGKGNAGASSAGGKTGGGRNRRALPFLA
ncbi:uncharacterized protein PV09_00696 [Verruconis gallopava]|uniref:Uncharacterized protein n=1 Tax=Verruconis gallopava TaxID=253628 RepID=A0A0D2APY5_9PEZI|nr:uncharacterized protein PV09_00696 [Verruconis gallopava]KIW08758.1 hypothetical protein PV09_00696 [Verruconis gallopava]